jgi:uncharacterized repeat protein (TIGR01451 family)
VILTANPDRLKVGQTANLEVIVQDQFDNPVADGTIVDFATTLGRLGVTSLTTGGGRGATTLSSNDAGQATITAISGGASDTTTVTFLPSIQISKIVNRNPAPTGSVLTYTITIQNTSAGGDDALLRNLRDIIPVSFAYVPGSTTSAAFSGDPITPAPDLTWTRPTPYNLAAGATITTTFQVSAYTGAGTYANIAVIEGDNFDPTSTGPTAQVTLSGPTLTNAVPPNGCNDAPVTMTISGLDFAPGITASLGPWVLSATWVNETTLTAIVPVDIAAGAYDLTVTNPGGASATRVGAYTARNCGGSRDGPLESGFLGTYGDEDPFAADNGDDDQVQVIFFEVPDGTPNPLYIRVKDPDCGDNIDQVQGGLVCDTPFTYTVYGGIGAYTNPDAQSGHPTTGISSGTLLTTTVFTENVTTDSKWYNFGPFDPIDGEPVSGKRIFKLSIVGGVPPPPVGNADLNLYNVALSTLPLTNTAPADARIFAFSWTFLISSTQYATPPPMFPYVDASVTTLTQHNWDYDNSLAGTAGITMTTPLRTIIAPDVAVSGNGVVATSPHLTFPGEHNTTWNIRCWIEPIGLVGDNLVTFWATDQGGRDLPLFARSTIEPPPPP